MNDLDTVIEVLKTAKTCQVDKARMAILIEAARLLSAVIRQES